MSAARDLLIVGAGGFVGAVARYLTGVVVLRRTEWAAPVGTAIVNVAGCLAIGAAMAWLETRAAPPTTWRLLVVVGFLGSFTTYSAFGFETLELLRAGRGAAAVANVGLQLLLGLGAVLLGRWTALAMIAP